MDGVILPLLIAPAKPCRRIPGALIVARLRIALAAAVVGLPLLGMDDPSPPPPPMVTDRPAVAASSVVVPPGFLQVENGFADTVNQGQHTFDGPETNLRFGIASKTELRLAAPNYWGGEETSSGFGDMSVGLKRQLGPAPGGFDVSLIVSLSFPTGAHAISSHGYDPAVQLPWSRSLSKN